MHRVAVATRAIRALAIADFLTVALATAAAGLIGARFSSADGLPLVGLGAVVTPPFVLLIWLACLNMYRTYDPLIVLTGVEYYRRAITATFVAFGAIAIFGFVIDLRAARPYFVFGLPVGLGLVLVSRWLLRQALRRARRRGASAIRAVLVVDPHADVSDSQFAEFIDIVARTSDSEPMAIASVALAHKAQSVVVRTSRFVESTWIQQLTWELDRNGLQLLIDATTNISMAPRMTVIPLRSRTLLAIEPLRLSSGSTPLKRLLDIAGSIIGMVVLAPLFLAALIATLLFDGRPVFFRQNRIGFEGHPFEIRKIRTMVRDAESKHPDRNALSSGTGLFKLPNDPRVTRVGRIIRRWSIDEVPQLWNVLRGEMSLVGPRPRLAQEHSADEFARSRTRVRPGLTGLWQVSGRSDLSAEETQVLDLMYIDSWSFVGDLVILIRTIKAVVSGKGAY